MKIPIQIIAEEKEIPEIWEENIADQTDQKAELVGDTTIGYYLDVIDPKLEELRNMVVPQELVTDEEFENFKIWITENYHTEDLANMPIREYRIIFSNYLKELANNPEPELLNIYPQPQLLPKNTDEFVYKGETLNISGFNREEGETDNLLFDSALLKVYPEFKDIKFSSSYVAIEDELGNVSTITNLIFEGGIDNASILDLLTQVENIPDSERDLLDGHIMFLSRESSKPVPNFNDMKPTACYCSGEIWFWDTKNNPINDRSDDFYHELGHKRGHILFNNTNPSKSDTEPAKEFIQALYDDRKDISWYGTLDHPDEAFAVAYQKWMVSGEVTSDDLKLSESVNSWFEKYIAPPNKLKYDKGKNKLVKYAMDDDWYTDFQNNPDNYLVEEFTSPDGKEKRGRITRKSDGNLMMEVFGTPITKNKSIPINYNTPKTP